MRKIRLDEAKNGMRLARPVFLLNGAILLDTGAELTEAQIARLKQWRISEIYISEEREVENGESQTGEQASLLQKSDNGEPQASSGPASDSFISLSREVQENVRKVHSEVEELLKRIRLEYHQEKLEVRSLDSVIRKLVNAPLVDRRGLILLSYLSSSYNYIYAHSINVCILSIILGYEAGFSEAQLVELAVAALYHDIGMMTIPFEVWDHPRRLDPREARIVEEHARKGMTLLPRMAIHSRMASAVAEFHHVNYLDFASNSVPLARDAIDLAQYIHVVKIADVFEALSHDRPYRPRFLPHEAMKYIITGRMNEFEPRIARFLVRGLGYYPVGSFVELSTGNFGMVYAINTMKPHLPTVLMLGHVRKGLDPAFNWLLDMPDDARMEWLSNKLISLESDSRYEVVGPFDERIVGIDYLDIINKLS